jgi:hypothetical protein
MDFYSCVTYRPDDAYVPFFADTEDTCLSYNEHAVPCSIA